MMSTTPVGLAVRGDAMLSVRDMRVRVDATTAYAVLDAFLDLAPGESLGIAGESGSGKTTLVQALFGYIRHGLTALEGQVAFRSSGPADRSTWEEFDIRKPVMFRKVRGKVLSLVPQSADSVLDPIVSIGAQLSETYRLGTNRPEPESGANRIEDLLRELGFTEPGQILRRYPHEVSGGQRQRVALAMALLPDPQILIMDEATTDLDVVTQQQVLSHIQRARRRWGFALVVVSHDLRVLRIMCEDLLIMYRGAVVESGPLQAIFEQPAHPYTAELLQRFRAGISAPGPQRAVESENGDVPWLKGCAYAPFCQLRTDKCDETPILIPFDNNRESRCWHLDRVRPASEGLSSHAGPRRQGKSTTAFLAVEALCASYRSGMLARRRDIVLHDVSLDVHPGEIVGVVGESGSGKTTLGRVIVGLHEADSGSILLDGRSIAKRRAADRPLDVRRKIQIIFQNPGNALNPARQVRDVLGRRVRVFEHLRGKLLRNRVEEVLISVGLPGSFGNRWCRELSGGEKQRVAIARALIGSPQLIVCDEIVSSLDVLAQARVVALLKELCQKFDLALIFISHDIGIVAGIADRIFVFHGGHICEQGPASSVVEAPQDEYTKRLLAAALL